MRATITSCGRRSSEPIIGVIAGCERFLRAVILLFDMTVGMAVDVA
jgi:hypothetical protein